MFCEFKKNLKKSKTNKRLCDSSQMSHLSVVFVNCVTIKMVVALLVIVM
jgi:hypothetical protein